MAVRRAERGQRSPDLRLGDGTFLPQDTCQKVWLVTPRYIGAVADDQGR